MPGFHDYFQDHLAAHKKDALPLWLTNQNKWKGCFADHQLTYAIRKRKPSPRILEHTRLSTSQKVTYHKLLSSHGLTLSPFHVSRFSLAALAHLVHLLQHKGWKPIAAQVEVRFGRSFMTFVDQVWRCAQTGRWWVVEFKLDTTGRRVGRESQSTGMLQGEFRSLTASQLNKDLVQAALGCLAFCATRRVDPRQVQAALSICTTAGSVRLLCVPPEVWKCALQWAAARDSRFFSLLPSFFVSAPQIRKASKQMAAADVDHSSQPDSLLGHATRTPSSGKKRARQQQHDDSAVVAVAEPSSSGKKKREQPAAAAEKEPEHKASVAAAVSDRKQDLDDPAHCFRTMQVNGEKLIAIFADPRNKKSPRSVSLPEVAAIAQDISAILAWLMSVEAGNNDLNAAREIVDPIKDSLGKEAQLALDNRLSQLASKK